MTWKSYAAVSGATVLAGWLASSPPANAPATSAPVQRRTPDARTAAESDIEQQAARLQQRVRQETIYRDPARNPFRFGARQTMRSAPEAGVVAAPPAVEAPPPQVPQGPAISLSGIAEDQAGERMERTAILSTPADVLLVREGDEVMG